MSVKQLSTRERSVQPGNVRLPQRCRQRHGAVLPLMAVTLAAVLGLLALAFDAGILDQRKRIAQNAADAGALAGASEILRTKPDSVVPAAIFETTRNGYTNGVNHAVVTVSNPPVSGYYVGNSNYVEVVIKDTVPTVFARIWGRTKVAVTSRAVGGMINPSNGCLYTLDPTADQSLFIHAGGDIAATSCDVIVNSNDPEALDIQAPGSSLSATTIVVTGGYSSQSVGGMSPVAQTGIAPTPDPLSGLALPTAPVACLWTNKSVSSGSETIYPGTYCGGIDISGAANVTMAAGTYFMKGRQGTAAFNLRNAARLSNQTGGVTIVIIPDAGGRYGTVELENSSFFTLTATTDPNGIYPGILFYYDPAAPMGQYSNFHSGTSGTLTGVIYMPSQRIRLGASGAGPITFNGGVVARQAEVESGGQVIMTGGLAGLGVIPPAIKKKSVVE